MHRHTEKETGQYTIHNESCTAQIMLFLYVIISYAAASAFAAAPCAIGIKIIATT